MRVIKGKDNIFSYKYTSCQGILVPFDVVRNGGTLAQSFEKEYYDSIKIILKNPTKENSKFLEWRVVKGNSEIVDRDVLIIWTTETIIFAVWEGYSKLTVDLGEGAKTSQSFETYYKLWTTIELQKPTRAGYIFDGWTVTSTNSEEELNSIVSGNMLTIGDVDTTLIANWKKGNLIKSFWCANESLGTSPYSFTYTGDCEVVDDGNDDWRVKFLTMGTFTPNIDVLIDAFLVGGGGDSYASRGPGGTGGSGIVIIRNAR